MSFEKKLKTEAPVEGQEKQELSPEEKSQKEEARHEAIQSAQASLQESAEQDYQVSQKKVKESKAQIYNLKDKDGNIDVIVKISEKNPESGLLNLGIDENSINQFKERVSGLNSYQTHNELSLFLAVKMAETLKRENVKGANMFAQRLSKQIEVLRSTKGVEDGKYLINFEKFVRYVNIGADSLCVEGLGNKLEDISGYKQKRKKTVTGRLGQKISRGLGVSTPDYDEMFKELSKAFDNNNIEQVFQTVKDGKRVKLSEEEENRIGNRIYSGSSANRGTEIKKINEYLVMNPDFEQKK